MVIWSPEAEVVRREVLVIGAVVVQLVGVVVIDGSEADLRPAPCAGRRPWPRICLERASSGADSIPGSARRFIRGDRGNLRNAGVIWEDGADRQAGKHGELLGERGGAGFKVEGLSLSWAAVKSACKRSRWSRRRPRRAAARCAPGRRRTPPAAGQHPVRD